MSRSCDICGKGVMHGNHVSKSFNHLRRTWKPNLITVRAVFDNGQVRTIKVCTRCYRSEFLIKKVKTPKVAVETK